MNKQAFDAIKKMLKENRDIFMSAVVCLSCNKVFDSVAPEDSCAACGIRYSPKPSNENCPVCGDDDYITHCRGCDAEEPEDLNELIGSAWKEYFDPSDDDYSESTEMELIVKIEKFIKNRLRKIEYAKRI